jgi:hypothetical protein
MSGSCFEGYWGRDFEISKVGDIVTFVAAGTDTDQLNFGDDEAVPTGMFAHAAL